MVRSASLDVQSRFFARNPHALSVIGLFEYMPGAYFYAKDFESHFVRVNRALLSIYGFENEADVIGKTDYDFHPPALAEAYRAEDRRVMAKGQAIPNQVWLVPHMRGTPAWYVSSKTPLFDPAGSVIGIAGVMYRIDTPEDRRTHFGALLPAIHHIEAHFREDIVIAEVAERTGLSGTHFNRQFRELLRMSPREYLLSLRVQEAQRLLSTTQHSLAQIAVEVGFYDQSHFTKRFRRVTGLTPRAYRQRFR